MEEKELKEFYNKLNFEEKSYIAHLITIDKAFDLIMLNQIKHIIDEIKEENYGEEKIDEKKDR